MIFTMANVALPGTSGFVGEFLTVIAAFSVSKVAAIFAATGVILSAVYGLFLYKRVVFGTITNETIELLNDLSAREKIILFPLAFLIILFGLYPSPILNLISVSSDSLVSLLEVGSLDNLTLGIKQ
jgi:NADH-quinone oxidoreductase subunit M